MKTVLKSRTALVTGIALVAWAYAPGAGAEKPLTDKALDQLQQAGPVCADAFDFVVLGDTRSGKPLEQPAVFKQAVQEVNILRPAFVADVGDLILGGAAEGLAPQWDEFDRVVAGCKVPFFPVTGNHDISDAVTERIWLERMGPVRYTFRYGNSLFVMLNSEEVGALERIPDEQVAWLKQTLEATDAKNIFLFLHQPLFAYEGDEAAGVEHWRKHWDNVAQVLRGHPVRVVFGGHTHVYRDCGVKDGVHYVISGGGGASHGGHAEEEGGFFHYLLVRVRGEEVSWSVIKPGSILPSNVVTSERVAELAAIRHKWVACEEVRVPYGAGLDRDVTVTITNPSDRPFDSTLTWEVPPGWSVTPTEKAYQAPAKGAAPLVFHIKADTPELVRYPVPKFKTQYLNTRDGAPVAVASDLALTPTTNAVRARGPVTPDGDLREWTAKPVPLTYGSRLDPNNPEDLQAQARFMWDKSHFYLAVETVDNDYCQTHAGDIVWLADNIELSLGDWSWGLTLTKAGPEVFLYEGVDASAEMVNTDVKLGIKRDGTHMTYEAVFPAALMKPRKLRAGETCKVVMCINDLDKQGSHHALELIPSSEHGPWVKVILTK